MNLEDKRLPDMDEFELEELRRRYIQRLVGIDMEIQQRLYKRAVLEQQMAYQRMANPRPTGL